MKRHDWIKRYTWDRRRDGSAAIFDHRQGSGKHEELWLAVCRNGDDAQRIVEALELRDELAAMPGSRL